jgi:hypothetical protein
MYMENFFDMLFDIVVYNGIAFPDPGVLKLWRLEMDFNINPSFIPFAL